MGDYKPVVIIGAPRSGTNMLRDVLCELPKTGTWPCDEINYIWRHGNIGLETDEFSPELATPQIKKYIRNQVDKVASVDKLDFVVEKTCANSLRVGFVNEVLPDAHYIFIVRNGLDVIASANLRWTAKLDIPYLIKKTKYVPITDLPYYASRYLWNRVYRLISGEKRLAFWGPQLKDMKGLLEKHSLNEICAIQWRRCVERSEQDFSKINESRITRVSYEGFVNNPVEELTRIVNTIGIDATAEQIAGSVKKVSNRSIGKWESQLEQGDLMELSPHVNDLLRHYRYDVIEA